jgi:hypothetical protein
MQSAELHAHISTLSEKAREIYEQKLRNKLESNHTGEAVAIHVDSGDYAVGKTHSEAAHKLLAGHKPDGRIVTFTIGPPTDADMRLAHRMLSDQAR